MRPISRVFSGDFDLTLPEAVVTLTLELDHSEQE